MRIGDFAIGSLKRQFDKGIQAGIHDMKQFFLGLKNSLGPYDSHSVEATCKAHACAENLIGL